jgi:hypothetical protein
MVQQWLQPCGSPFLQEKSNGFIPERASAANLPRCARNAGKFFPSSSLHRFNGCGASYHGSSHATIAVMNPNTSIGVNNRIPRRRIDDERLVNNSSADLLA